MFKALGSVIATAGIFLAGLFGYVAPAQAPVGADTFQYVGGQRYKLAGSGVGTTDTSIVLQSFTLPVSDTEITMADFGGTIGYMTLEPGVSGKQEFISFTGVSQNSNNTQATLTGVTRGLSPVAPYTTSSTYKKTHAGGTFAIISNSPQLYDKLVGKTNDETITGIYTFSSTSQPVYDGTPTFTNSLALITKGYADGLSFAGAPDSSQTVKGIVEIATDTEVASSTSAGGTTAPLVIRTTSATSTYNSATAALKVVVTQNNGKIDSNFIEQTSAYTWSGAHSFSSATSTFNATTSIAASASSKLQLNGVQYVYPQTLNASSSVLASDATGNLSWSRQSGLIYHNTAPTTVSASTASTTIFASTISAGALGTNNVYKVEIPYTSLLYGAAQNWYFEVGVGTASTTLVSTSGASGEVAGMLTIILSGKNSATAQFLTVYLTGISSGVGTGATTENVIKSVSLAQTAANTLPVTLIARQTNSSGAFTPIEVIGTLSVQQ